MHLVHLVIDAANVVGSRPDGWWRDRAGAAARLVDQVAAALSSGPLGSEVLGSGAAGLTVTVVLEGAARAGVPAGPYPVEPGRTRAAGLDVVHAERDGDSAIVRLVGSLVGSLVTDGAEVHVVTADRGLRAQVVAEGADALGPSWLLDRL